MLAPLAASFCSDGAPPKQRFVIRDSAGVRIVDNTGSLDALSDRAVAADPVFRVGWRDSDPDFQTIVAGHIGQDRVWVADGRSSLVYAFTQSGELLGTLGGPGEGPGEFRFVATLIGLGGDTILVSDVRTSRLSIFAGTEHAYDLRYDNVLADSRYGPVGRTASGHFVSLPINVGLRPDQEPGWKDYPVLRTRDFRTTDTLAMLPIFLKFGEPGDMNPIYHYGAAVVAGGRVAHMVTERAQVTWLDLEGEPTQIARWDEAPEPVTDEMWSAYERRAREGRSARRDPARFERELAERRDDFGGVLPLFRFAHGDRVGNVWLSEYEIGGTSRSAYRIVSATGEWLGRLEFPRDITILDITDTRVLGVERDGFDVQAIVVYEILKP